MASAQGFADEARRIKMNLSNSFGVCRMEVVQAFSDEDSMAGPQIRHASLNVYDKMEECSSLDIL